MCDKSWTDGDVHSYFSPFSTPHDGFISIISGISDIKVRLAKELGKFEALNDKKEVKDLKKVSRGIDKRKKPKRKKKKREIRDLLKLKKPLEPKSEIDFLLNQKVAYPPTVINKEKLEKVSNVFKKR